MLAAGSRAAPLLTLETACPTMPSGGDAVIVEWIEQNPGARLVIVDTFGKIKPPKQLGEDSYQADYRVGAKLKKRDAFLDARHVAVVIRGQSEDLIDSWLRGKGIERRIALVVPGYIEALHVAARTDLVAFVPRRLIAALSKQLSLLTLTPPFDPGIDEQHLFYPTRAQMDPGSIWLRNLMLGIGREMERGTGRTT